MSEERIRFIRRHGRIIPIKTKVNKEKRNKGIAYIGAGAGISVGSGYVSGKLFKKAVRTGYESTVYTKGAKLAFKHPEHFSDVGFNLMRKSAAKSRKTGRQLRASRLTFKAGAGFLGGIFIGQGIAEILQAHRKDGRLHDIEEIGSAVAGVAAVKLGEKSFKSGVGRKFLKAISRGKLG